MYGAIRDDLCVCHTCDVPACVRPDHLFVGTQAANLQDMDQKGRRKTKLSILDVTQIKKILRAKAATHKAIASMFGVSEKQIENIKYGHVWAHVA